MPFIQAFCNDSIFANEELRLESFKKWPRASPVGAAALAKAGLFYIGESVVGIASCLAAHSSPHTLNDPGFVFI